MGWRWAGGVLCGLLTVLLLTDILTFPIPAFNMGASRSRKKIIWHVHMWKVPCPPKPQDLIAPLKRTLLSPGALQHASAWKLRCCLSSKTNGRWHPGNAKIHMRWIVIKQLTSTPPKTLSMVGGATIYGPHDVAEEPDDISLSCWANWTSLQPDA